MTTDDDVDAWRTKRPWGGIVYGFAAVLAVLALVDGIIEGNPWVIVPCAVAVMLCIEASVRYTRRYRQHLKSL